MYGSVIDWGPMSQEVECIRWCQGWIDCQALTHSALQRDHMLTPCQSERENNKHAQLITNDFQQQQGKM